MNGCGPHGVTWIIMPGPHSGIWITQSAGAVFQIHGIRVRRPIQSIVRLDPCMREGCSSCKHIDPVLRLNKVALEYPTSLLCIPTTLFFKDNVLRIDTSENVPASMNSIEPGSNQDPSQCLVLLRLRTGNSNPRTHPHESLLSKYKDDSFDRY